MNCLRRKATIATQALLFLLPLVLASTARTIELTHLRTPGFGPDPNYVGIPAAATDGTRSVAVFAGGTKRELRSRAMSSAGVPLGESSLRVTKDVIAAHIPPAIAWIGDRYVAAWQDGALPSAVHFVELDRDGRAIPGTERPVVTGLGSPQLCWNGERLLLLGEVVGTYGGLRGFILDVSGETPSRTVEFDDRYYQVSCAPTDDGFVLAGTWWFGLDVFELDREGVVARARLDTGGPSGSDYHPQDAHVTFDGTVIRIAWIGNTVNDYWLQTASLDQDLEAVTRETLTLDGFVALQQAFVDHRQLKVVVLADTYAANIQMWSFDEDDTFVGATTLVDAPRFNRHPTILSVASGYTLVWFNDDAYRSVRGSFFSSLTDVTPQAGEVLSSIRLSQSLPMIASSGSTGVVAWLEPAADRSSIYTAAIDGNGAVSNQRLFGVGNVHSVRLTSGEGQVFLSWQEGLAIAGIPLGPDGSPIVAQPWRLSSLDHDALGHDVTWDGEGFFFVYQSGRIWGARAGPEALNELKPLTEPQPRVPGMSDPWEEEPLIAAGSEGMLLLWTSTAMFDCVQPACGSVSTYHSVMLSRDGHPNGDVRAVDRRASRLIAVGDGYAIRTGPHGCVQRLDIEGVPLDAEPLCVSPSRLELTPTPLGFATSWTSPDDGAFIVLNEIQLDGPPTPSRLLEPPVPTSATIASVGGRVLIGLTQVVDQETNAREAFVATDAAFEDAPLPPAPPVVLSYARISSHQARLRWLPDPQAIGSLVEVETPRGAEGVEEKGDSIVVTFGDVPYRVRMRAWNRGGVSAAGPWIDIRSRLRPVRR